MSTISRQLLAWIRPRPLGAGSCPPASPTTVPTSRLSGDALTLSGAAANLPARIAPDGHLDFYRERAADFQRRHPDRPVPAYYLGYGDKYVRRFSQELNPKLSPQGQRWLAQARVNLQLALENERACDPRAFDQMELDDKALTKFAYESHPKAYLDAGLSELPLKDLIRIGMTPDTRDLFNKAGLEQVVQTAVGVACERIQALLAAAPSQLRDQLAGLSQAELGQLGLGY